MDGGQSASRTCYNHHAPLTATRRFANDAITILRSAARTEVTLRRRWTSLSTAGGWPCVDCAARRTKPRRLRVASLFQRS